MRYRVTPTGEATVSEAIGVVQSVQPDDDGAMKLSVVNRKGVVREVPVAAIEAAKIFPL